MKNRIQIVQKDITTMAVDAIVNAANNSLLGGGGVDGAIHRRAGKKLLAACRTLGGCVTGNAKITLGYNLPASYVIHTVGPVWQGGNHGEADLLASAYWRSLEVAAQKGIKTIAFPAISTGVYGYHVQDAARIALDTVCDFLQNHDLPQKVWFVCFSSQALTIYRELYDALC